MSKLYYDGYHVDGLPTRSDLVYKNTEPEICEEVTKTVYSGKPLYFMPNDVNEGVEYYGSIPCYKLVLYGVTLDGMKTSLRLEGVDVYFDVRINAPRDIATLNKALVDLPYTCIEPLEAYPLMGFRETPAEWRRVFFNSHIIRKKAIDKCQNAGLETASDSKSAYYYQVARNYKLALSEWLVIDKYSTSNGNSKCNYDITANIKNIRTFSTPFIDGTGTEVPKEHPLMIKDRLLVMTWDIETYSSRKTGEVPMGDNDTDCVFMICATFHWKDSTKPLYQVCLSDIDIKPDEKWTTVVCGNEKNLLLAFAQLFNDLMPDIVTGFNDGNYDWPFIIAKAEKYQIVEEMISMMSAEFVKKRRSGGESYALSWHVRESQIKISAEENHLIKYMKAPGFIPIDTRVIFKQLFPKAEVGAGSSLNFYLKKCKLDSKEDLPYKEMWRIYEARDYESMQRVASYCIVDARRCQELLVSRVVVNDRRAVALLAFVSMSDAFMRAGGHKVGNMITAYAEKRGILCTTQSTDEVGTSKYPGAWVFHPRKGLVPNPRTPEVERLEEIRAASVADSETNELPAFVGREVEDISKRLGRPVTGLDFSSLYPNIIITYNFSPETFVSDREYKEQLEAAGYDLHEVRFPYEGREVLGWFVRHGNVREKYGIFGTLLFNLFNRRSMIKKELKVFEEKLEELEANGLKNTEEYAETKFQYDMLDARQKALKLYMNTFYGETGNKRSSFFLLHLAGGVTTAGQYNIKMVADYLMRRSYIIMYGDTDSVYVSCPYYLFMEVDKQYAAGVLNKREYWHKLIEISIEDMNKIRDEVNDMLQGDNGTRHLTMAYEEVLWPILLAGKKKYYGIPHVGIPNLDRDLFIRGIDIIKQGQTQFAKDIGMKIMRQSMSLDNNEGILQIVEDVLLEAINYDQWKLKDFEQTAAWKPKKKNITVHKFIHRMTMEMEREKAKNKILIDAGKEPEETLYYLPEPGERFSFVCVKQPEAITLSGHVINIKKSDLMEYTHVAEKRGYTIDISHYLTKYVAGICARFITSEFENERIEDETQRDKDSCDKARKYLENFIKNHTNTSTVNSAKYKKAWRRADKLICQQLSENIDSTCAVEVLHNEYLNWECYLCDDVINTVIYNAKMKAEEENIEERVDEYIFRYGINPKTGADVDLPDKSTHLFRLSKLFTDGGRKSIMNIKLTQLDMMEINLRQQLNECLPKMKELALFYDVYLREMVESFREEEMAAANTSSDTTGGINSLPENIIEPEIMQKVYDIWNKLVSIFIVRAKHIETEKKLKVLKAKRAKAKPEVDKKTFNRLVEKATAEQE